MLLGLIFLGAAALYSFRLGGQSLGASEAFSAAAAAAPDLAAIVRIPVERDPGKQVFYYAFLHWFTSVFGRSETSLRAPSVLFALVALALLFALGREMFSETVALGASAIWAFNPLIMIYSHRARMYPMFVAIALWQMLALWRVRERPSVGRVLASGVSGAALLYVHLAGALVLGAGVAMLVRDLFGGRRNPGAWLGLAITMVLFAPYAPILAEQSRALMFGHWLDWIGAGESYSLLSKIAVALAAAGIGLAFVFVARGRADRDEPIRWCAAWTLLPFIALIGGTVLIRPMFNLRYALPSLCAGALLAAVLLRTAGARAANLATAGIAMTFLLIAPLMRPVPQPWREIARRVEAGGGPSDPVFFESGFIASASGVEVGPNPGFPGGYYRVPFDYYFRGRNPRYAVPGSDAARAREIVAARIRRTGGGWLISWKDGRHARTELPQGAEFRVAPVLRRAANRIAVYRIETVPADRR